MWHNCLKNIKYYFGVHSYSFLLIIIITYAVVFVKLWFHVQLLHAIILAHFDCREGGLK